MTEPQNPGFRNGRPVPDPTVLTDAAIAKVEKSITAYINGQVAVLQQRLEGIDKATELITDAATGAEVKDLVGHLRELSDEKFSSIATQFTERDTRQEREARDNKVAVDAAFAAQKEAASEQNKSNTLAITKSEVATTETINKLAELFRTTTDALADQIVDVKERTGRIESGTNVRAEVAGEKQGNLNVVIGIAASAVAAIGVIAGIVIAIAAGP